MVDQKVVCCYDGSFEGFLSTIFLIYQQKLTVEDICAEHHQQNRMFAKSITIETDRDQAERVLKGLIVKSDKKVVISLYRCFLSEMQGIEYRIFKVIQKIFSGQVKDFFDYGDDNMIELHKVLKMIRREVHRMHAFVRFQELKDGSFAAVVDPDFNVLPLIGEHFKKRYPVMEWLIFDSKRQYGILYSDNNIQYVRFEGGLKTIDSSIISDEEISYQNMWKQYFKSVNISERNNSKLHLRHVPKRYWKNLIEKQ